MVSDVTKGITSGAVGTAALNITTYLDMALRGRPGSQVPAEDVRKVTEIAGLQLAQQGRDRETAQNRRQALGSLMGYVTGLGVGALYGLVRTRLGSVPLPAAASGLGLAAMAGSDVPSTLLGVTDPTTWSAKSWASDLVPHLAYGIATALAYEALE